jgi:pyruvate-ferredoxin/flavodoxin oxidoreductase
MWLRKPRTPASDSPFPGRPEALDGQAAAYTVATLAADAVLVQQGSSLVELVGRLPQLSPDAPRVLPRVAPLGELAALHAALAASGLRTAVFADRLSGSEALAAAVGRRLAGLTHLTATAGQRQAGALQGGHDHYLAAGSSGVFQLFASNVQEAADLSLIGHRVAELALTPGICAQDLYATSHSVQNLLLADPALVETYLGRASDVIAAPTPAQRIVFGAERRRIPRLVDPDHPAGIGGLQGPESYPRAVAAQGIFFSAHLAALVAQAMDEYGELSGRRYEPVAAYRCNDADFVVLAMGAVVEALKPVVDHLRATRKIRAGVLNLTLWRPFPGALLTRLLKGKRAVTVLERSDAQLVADLPLTTELRGALARAADRSVKRPPEAAADAYAVYTRPGDKPRICSAHYGLGGDVPTFAELCAVFENMARDADSRERVYVGMQSGRPDRRFPHLQVLQQELDEHYPQLGASFLEPARVEDPKGAARVARLFSLSLQGGMGAVNLLARALAGALESEVRSFPQGGLVPGMQPVRLTLSHGAAGEAHVGSKAADTVLVSAPELLEGLSADELVAGAGLVVVSNEDAKTTWEGLTRQTESLIRERGVRLTLVDARGVAAETATQLAFIDALTVWALLGAGARAMGLSDEEVERCADCLRELLATDFAGGDTLAGSVLAAFGRGATAATQVPWEQWPAGERAPAPEREAPWTVRAQEPADETIFDPVRFWHSVGFLYDTGLPEATLVDPYLALGVMPGGSSAHRDMSQHRLRLPQWIAERCTGCGQCWAQCPDSALPATIQGVAELVDTAMGLCKREGAPMTQLGRITGHLVKQAHRIAAGDGLHQYASAAALLREAFSRLTGKMGLDEETLAAISADFDRLEAMLFVWPFARTEAFFDDPEQARKGDGRLLSIAVNPASCKACGACLAVCPEGAFEWAEQDAPLLERYRAHWALQMALPEVSPEVIERCSSASGLASEVHRLLDRGVYHSLVGGDGALPGDGGKTAVHLLTGAIESVMRARFTVHVDRLTRLIDALSAKVQGRIEAAVHINDFAAFAQRLDRLDKSRSVGEQLAGIVGAQGPAQGLDETELKRLTGLIGDLEEQRRRYADGRACLVLALAQDGVVQWSGTYPDNPQTSPWLSYPGQALTPLAEGLFEGLARRLADEFASTRLAELEIAGRYDPAKDAHPGSGLGWESFTAEERELLPRVVIVAAAGQTGAGDVAALRASRYPLLLALLDSAGLAPDEESAEELEEPGASLLSLLAGDEAFVMQTTIGHPGHLIHGVVASLKQQCPAIMRIHAPDPLRNGILPDQVAAQARRAFESRAVPLVLRAGGRDAAMLDLQGNPDGDADWATDELEARAASGELVTIRKPITVADWLVHEARFRHHFRIIGKGNVSDAMRELSVFIALPAAERAGLTPFVRIADAQQRECIATVAPAIVAATERALRVWRQLRELAMGGPPQQKEAEPGAPRPAPEAVPAPAQAGAQDAQRLLTERLLALCGYGTDPDFFGRSLKEFLQSRHERTQTPDG